MIQSKIISKCIEELADFRNSLMSIENDSQYADGYNCAVSCVKGSVQTRIDSLCESLQIYDPNDKINEADECYNEIASLLTVLNEDCEGADDSEFGKSFTNKIKECIKQLADIQSKYS